MIYALFVAIDEYPIPSHCLNGCVNDATALLNYLEDNYACEELEIKTLFNEQATKQNIIQAFDHFKAAKDGDTCLFYYSGHGAQAPAPAEFQHLEADGKVETLVCYDSRIQGGFDLMDKELSFLIWEANLNKDIHFAAVFDCCHSGTNTRSEKIRARKVETHEAVPRLADFHGHERYITTRDENTQQVRAKVPVGRHVQLAAARANQTAKELRIGTQTRGAFTYNLVALLEQNNGQVSYRQLLTSLETKVANYVREQVPQIYAHTAADKNHYFLGQAPTHRDERYLANYDAKAKGWFVNMGQINGLPTDKVEQIKFRLHKEGSLVPIEIEKVEMTRAAIAPIAGLDVDQSYAVILDEVPVKAVVLGFTENCTDEDIARFTQGKKDASSVYYEFTENRDDATYWIDTKGEQLTLLYAYGNMPILRPIQGLHQDAVNIFLTEVASVAHWHAVLDIQNPKSTIRAQEYEISLYRIDDPLTWMSDPDNNDDIQASLCDIDETLVFNYDYNENAAAKEDRWVPPGFRLKVKNTGRRTLFFSAVSCLANYGITNKFLPTKELAPGQEQWLEDIYQGFVFHSIPLGIDDAFIKQGVNETNEYIKLFVSTHQLNTDSFNQDALELYSPLPELERMGRTTRHFPPQPDWKTVDIHLKIVRPVMEEQLVAGQANELLEMMTIDVPAGFSATATLNNQEEASRSLTGNLPPLSTGWANHSLKRGLDQQKTVDTLELFNVTGADTISADNPLKLKLSQQAAEGEMLLPIGYDEETGMYYPLGILDEETGIVRIDELPAPSATNTRSLGGSIKIFFQKTINKYIPIGYNYPQLSLGAFEAKADAAAGVKVAYSINEDATKQAVEGAERIVLFIHGIIGDTTEMPKILKLVKDEAGKSLEDQYDLWLTFDYENLNDEIQTTAENLKSRLAAVGLAEGHNKTLHIVAHSMGGLVSRWFIEQLGGNAIVQHLYQLGTPNQGSPYGSLYEMATPLLATAVNGASFLKPYIFVLKYAGKFVDKAFTTLKQMKPDSDFYKALNTGTDPAIPYTIIAGNTQLIPADIQDKHNTLLKKLMARFRSRGHYDALDLLLFKEANDIAVSTQFIKQIPGADQWQTPPKTIEVASDHISYFGNLSSLEVLKEELL